MDECILADTGINFYSVVGVAFVVLCVAAFLLAKHYRLNFRGIALIAAVGVLTFGAFPSQVFAADMCEEDSSPSVSGSESEGGEASLADSVLRYKEVYFSANPTNGEQSGTWLVDSDVLMWKVISSSDGTKLAGIDDRGYIYTSSDSGATWTMRTLIAGINDKVSIVDIAGSSDGTKLVLTVSNGYIYTSSDSGATWIEQTGSGMRYWGLAVSSSDGSRLAAIAEDTIYTSSDSGVTWTPYLIPAGTSSWASIASSSDGMKLIVAPWGGFLYTSSDGGMTWTEQASSGSTTWYSVASSSDGSTLVASDPSDIYLSFDSGATWTSQPSLNGLGGWYNVAVSADGSAFVAANNYVYTSYDSGANWIQQPTSGDRSRSALAISVDGSQITSAADGGVFVSLDSGVSWGEHRLITPVDSYTLDIDRNTAGLQRTVDMTATEGWSATLNPDTGYFEVTVTDESIFDPDTMRGYYSIYVEGQSQPLFAPIIFYRGVEIG